MGSTGRSVSGRSRTSSSLGWGTNAISKEQKSGDNILSHCLKLLVVAARDSVRIAKGLEKTEFRTMGQPRREKMNPLAIETHHIWSRCVRGAFLLGKDPVTGEDVSHRRAMLEGLIEYQASVFAVDWGTDHCLSNHLHGTGRNRPDIANQWSDEEVAWRWKIAWPAYCPVRGWQRDPTDEEIRELLLRDEREPGHLDKLRGNLSNLSWFIARIKQPIAYFANRDNPDPQKHCRGHFWEGRYGNRKLGTYGEVFSSFLYNDLQQVKAGIVDCLEESNFSAIQKQLRSFASQAFRDMHDRVPTDHDDDHAELERLEQLFANCYYSPLSRDAVLMTEADENPPPHELVLPAGYYHQPVHPNRDFAQATPAEIVDESIAPNFTDNIERAAGSGESTWESVDGVAPDGGNDVRRIVARRSKPRTIDKRLKQKQRRRASRSSILGLDANEYLSLARTVAERMVEERRQHSDGGLSDEAWGSAKSQTPSTMAPPDATPSTFHRSLTNFTAWLASQALAPLKRIFSDKQELPRPPT